MTNKVIFYDVISEKDYDDLLHTCGLAICTSVCEGFCHAVNEAMSAGCNLILSPIKPFQELAPNALFSDTYKTLEHPATFCTLVDIMGLKNVLIDYLRQTKKEHENISELNRIHYETRHKQFISEFKIPTIPEFSLEKLFIAESELPYVSIITLTYNRQEFIPLAKYSYLIQSYPADKLEWVIINDGESIEELLIGIPNVKYIQLPEKISIPEKRNIGIDNAMYDVLVMMDDDDVYPNNSILTRVSMMLYEPKKECVFCTTIPCYDIQKRISFMNVPPNSLEMSERVSEATLCFTRDFYNERCFQGLPEGDKFIRGREQMCREISPQNVIVSLVHSKNISSRKISGEANGCHYGFCNELFELVESIS